MSDDYSDADLLLDCKTEEIFPKYISQLQTCKEDFPPYGRLVFSTSCMIIQYLLPTISIAIGGFPTCFEAI